jgi:hypothetical protein
MARFKPGDKVLFIGDSSDVMGDLASDCLDSLITPKRCAACMEAIRTGATLKVHRVSRRGIAVKAGRVLMPMLFDEDDFCLAKKGEKR